MEEERRIAKEKGEVPSFANMGDGTHHRPPTIIVALTEDASEDITQTCLNEGMNEVYQNAIISTELAELREPLIQKMDSAERKSSITPRGLGLDLPHTEAELFQIKHLPILDLGLAISLLGSEEVAREIFESLKVEGLRNELPAIQMAREKGDWSKVGELAHKMKGGAVFGTVRLHYAILYLERYIKAGHVTCLKELYTQMLYVIDETMMYL